MRSIYRRHIKIKLVDAAQKETAHGWATSEDAQGNDVLHYFACDQERFLYCLTQSGVSAMRLQFERMGIYPKSITIKRTYNTFTYKILSYRRRESANDDRQVA